MPPRAVAGCAVVPRNGLVVGEIVEGDVVLEPLQARAQEFQQNPARVRTILNQGTETAREVARETLEEVRRVMGLGYA